MPLPDKTTLQSHAQQGLGRRKLYDVRTDPNLDADGRDNYLRDHWRTIFYVSFAIKFQPGGETVTIENAALRLLGNTFARSQTTVNALGANS